MNQAAYRYVPQALLDRRKMGFDAPMDDWLRGPLRDWAEDLPSETRLEREGVFKPHRIRERWRDHVLGRRNRQAALWVVLVFQAWKQRWLPAG
ncbi:MAG TPA: asparagine synthase-related protein [Dongiaceae bacterium]|jgi:asparagine synthase (glutamine-hydrolysing)